MQAIYVRLVELIRAAQQASPFEHLGQIWAQPLSQEAWCKAGDFRLRTFQELIKVPPIRKLRCKVGGRITTLLRVGEPGTEAHYALAKDMARYYCEATKAEWVPPDQIGMLVGLAQRFPDGFQVDIFKHTVRRWSEFRDDVRLEIRLAKLFLRLGLDPFEGDALSDHTLTTARRYHWRPEKLRSRRVYRRPFIPYMLAFWPVAVELFIDERELRDGPRPERVWQWWSDPAQRSALRHAESISRGSVG